MVLQANCILLQRREIWTEGKQIKTYGKTNKEKEQPQGLKIGQLIEEEKNGNCLWMKEGQEADRVFFYFFYFILLIHYKYIAIKHWYLELE